ncbi:MAG: metallopeptidase family protein [Patescibacteria group bacterium]|jgi:predicted Zn-dependent protease with MMP-like domain
MEIQEFEQVVEDAIFAIPKKIRDRIVNVAFVVEDNSRAARKTEHEVRSRGMLLGLYQGVPLGKRGPYYSGVLPDKITIFKTAIEQVARDDVQAIKTLIQEVVHHEVAHFLGMNEREVRVWEKRKKIKQHPEQIEVLTDNTK